MKHALLLDQRGQDSTACWERAVLLTERGMYLPEQIEEDWSRSRRDAVSGLMRDSVHRWTTLLRQMGQVDEAILRVRSYWLEHLTDEDMLRSLIAVLSEQERFGEAEEYYAKAQAALAEDGHVPDDRTKEALEAVRALKIQRPSAQNASGKQDLSSVILSSSFSYSEPPLSLPSPLQAVSPRLVPNAGGEGNHSATSFHNGMIAEGCGWQRLPIHSSSNLRYLIATDRGFSETSLRCLEQITWQWRALQRQGDISVLSGIFAHMTLLQEVLETTFDEKVRCELWRILAHVQVVARFELKEKRHFSQRKALNEAAIVSARNSGDTLLTAAAIGHLAHLCLREEHDLSLALHLLTYAYEHANGCSALQGWLSLVMASLAAHEGRQQACERLLTTASESASHTQTVSQEKDLSFTDFNPTSVNVFAGNCWLTLGEPKNASVVLTSIDIETLSMNRQASAYYDLARASIAAGELEEAQRSAFRAIDLALTTDNGSLLPRFFALASGIQQRDPKNVQALALICVTHV